MNSINILSFHVCISEIPYAVAPFITFYAQPEVQLWRPLKDLRWNPVPLVKDGGVGPQVEVGNNEVIFSSLLVDHAHDGRVVSRAMGGPRYDVKGPEMKGMLVKSIEVHN